MAQFGFKFNTAKAGFFDADKIVSKLDRGTRRVLSKFGAFVRRRAKSSIRKRKKISEPGRPPSSRTGLLKRFIFFFYDPARQGVVIGPTALNGRGYGGEVAELLEFGGDAMRQFVFVNKDDGHPLTESGSSFRDRLTGQFVSRRKAAIRFSRTAPRRRVKYKARPYMNPALEQELPGLPKMWADQVY